MSQTIPTARQRTVVRYNSSAKGKAARERFIRRSGVIPKGDVICLVCEQQMPALEAVLSGFKHKSKNRGICGDCGAPA